MAQNNLNDAGATPLVAGPEFDAEAVAKSLQAMLAIIPLASTVTPVSTPQRGRHHDDAYMASPVPSASSALMPIVPDVPPGHGPAAAARQRASSRGRSSEVPEPDAKRLCSEPPRHRMNGKQSLPRVTICPSAIPVGSPGGAPEGGALTEK